MNINAETLAAHIAIFLGPEQTDALVARMAAAVERMTTEGQSAALVKACADVIKQGRADTFF